MRVDLPSNLLNGAVNAVNSYNGIQFASELGLGDAVWPDMTDRPPDGGVHVLNSREGGCRVLGLESLVLDADSVSERRRRLVFVDTEGKDDGEISPVSLRIDGGPFVVDPNPFRLKPVVLFHLGAVR